MFVCVSKLKKLHALAISGCFICKEIVGVFFSCIGTILLDISFTWCGIFYSCWMRFFATDSLWNSSVYSRFLRPMGKATVGKWKKNGMAKMRERKREKKERENGETKRKRANDWSTAITTWTTKTTTRRNITLESIKRWAKIKYECCLHCHIEYGKKQLN